MNPLLLDIPEQFSTPRLTLRIPQPGDGAIIYSGVRESLPELKRWMPWATDEYTQENAEEWCRRAIAAFITRSSLRYRIYMKDGPEYLGNIGAERFDWEVTKCEIGYWLRTSHYGRGYITEAAGGLIQMLKGIMRPNRIEIRCDVQNLKSRRVAERLGFELEGILRADTREKDGKLRDTCVYALVAPAV